MEFIMAVGVWEPDKDQPTQAISSDLLVRFAAVDEDATGAALEEAGLAGENWVMSLENAAWEIADSLGTDELVHLIRLFTLLEMNVPGWDAGKQSPVIPLVRILRDRGVFEPALRKWIKANTKNRYLPYGSAL